MPAPMTRVGPRGTTLESLNVRLRRQELRAIAFERPISGLEKAVAAIPARVDNGGSLVTSHSFRCSRE